MVKRILLELALFLTPFLIFFIYRSASRELSVRDRWPITMLVIVGTVLAVAALIVTPLLAPSDDGKCFQAARYENGETIPAKRIPCDEVTVPETGTVESPEQQPVAPRDETVR
ncbi:MAG: DUF6111 family protein [Hyphomonadaceae bacterium]